MAKNIESKAHKYNKLYIQICNTLNIITNYKKSFSKRDRKVIIPALENLKKTVGFIDIELQLCVDKINKATSEAEINELINIILEYDQTKTQDIAAELVILANYTKYPSIKMIIDICLTDLDIFVTNTGIENTPF